MNKLINRVMNGSFFVSVLRVGLMIPLGTLILFFSSSYAKDLVINGCVIETYTECSSINLKEADLEGVLLDSSSLTGVDFTDANLMNANLHGADLAGTNLTNANLENADMGAADLATAELVGAILINTNLSGSYLSNTNLSNADLTQADLSFADLQQADFTGATLTDAVLRGATWGNTTCVDGTNSDDNPRKVCAASALEVPERKKFPIINKTIKQVKDKINGE